MLNEIHIAMCWNPGWYWSWRLTENHIHCWASSLYIGPSQAFSIQLVTGSCASRCQYHPWLADLASSVGSQEVDGLTLEWKLLIGQHLPVWRFDPFYIVTCQRGGVSNEPPGQRQDTGPGILWSHTWFALFLLRQGEPGTSQYYKLGPNFRKPVHPIWTKGVISQSTTAIDGWVNDFLGPNEWSQVC